MNGRGELDKRKKKASFFMSLLHFCAMQRGLNNRVNSTGNSSSREEESAGMMVMRKGPWMAEEDEILMEYVNRYGPRDWSSIRSKGLLPRTGKSCRLRWVNKLKPDLKTGCKFSPEEERVVIDLQARFGNKWARIATHLPGRTDNDVKNFWSTRQKRLARILQTPLPIRSQKNNGKLPISALEGSSFAHIPYGEESSTGQCSKTTYLIATDMVQMPPDLVSPNLLTLDPTLPLLEPTIDRKPCLLNTQPTQLPFNQLPHPLLDFPLLPECQDIVPGFGDMNFQDDFSRREICECTQFPEGLPFFGLEVGQHGIDSEHGNPNTPDSFFDDFPADMFDYLEPPPPSSTQ